MTTVAVVTVSYFSGAYLRDFLDSLRPSAAQVVDIVVVDNASDDELDRVVAGIDGVRIVRAPHNLGYGKAMNLGNSVAAASEWLLISNPDLTLSPGALDELIAVGEQDPSIGVLGPTILTPSGEIYPSARRLPSLRHGVGHALFGQLWKDNPWTRGYLADRENPPRQREAGWLSGAFLLLRREAFDSVGGFDDKFFMYFEDVDLSARLSRTGWRVMYAPSATVSHAGGHSTQSVNRQMIRVHHDSAYKYLAARYRAPYLAPLRWALFAGLKLRARLATR
jgi:N-acetylglucosaminyl-diphospho-decaprenol L-rhamnosyltransferase